MKNFTSLFILICFAVVGLVPINAIAQTTNLPPVMCFYTSDDECISIGYLSVTDHINLPGENQSPKLDVEIIFRATCNNIAEIRITPTQGQLLTIPADSITGVNQTITFVVNANSFKDGELKVTIEFTDGSKTMVDIMFDETMDCGAIFPLPVELKSFKGRATQSGISLEWETASEQNNSHFEVERSTDGTTFTPLATVQGNGTTSIPMKYTAADKLPQKGTNYYRLKQVDYDNTSSYSKTISVAWKANDALTVNLLPNPCRGGNCNIAINNAANTETLVQLRDMAGRIVFSKTVSGDSYLLELPMQEFTRYKGLYFLTATTATGQVVHQRVVLE